MLSENTGGKFALISLEAAHGTYVDVPTPDYWNVREQTSMLCMTGVKVGNTTSVTNTSKRNTDQVQINVVKVHLRL